MNFPGMPGAGGGNPGADGMNDQEQAMVKTVSFFLPPFSFGSYNLKIILDEKGISFLLS